MVPPSEHFPEALGKGSLDIPVTQSWFLHHRMRDKGSETKGDSDGVIHLLTPTLQGKEGLPEHTADPVPQPSLASRCSSDSHGRAATHQLWSPDSGTFQSFLIYPLVLSCLPNPLARTIGRRIYETRQRGKKRENRGWREKGRGWESHTDWGLSVRKRSQNGLEAQWCLPRLWGLLPSLGTKVPRSWVATLKQLYQELPVFQSLAKLGARHHSMCMQ